jgi:hypothetical protein
LDSFATLTEFSVAIAGFSGIAIAIGARDGAVSSLTQFRNLNLLNFSIGAAFGSVLPPLMSHLGQTGESIWTYSSGLFAAIAFYLVIAPFVGRAALSPSERKMTSWPIWIVSVGGTAIAGVAQILNVFGFFGHPGPGPLYAGIVWTLLMATIQFYRLFSAAPATTNA